MPATVLGTWHTLGKKTKIFAFMVFLWKGEVVTVKNRLNKQAHFIGSGGSVILDRLIKSGFIEKMTLEPRPRKEVRHG